MCEPKFGIVGYAEAMDYVIGSMLIDERCVPLVMSKLQPEDFADPTCRNVFNAIRKLMVEGRPIDPVPVQGVLGDDSYFGWMRKRMEETPTAANVEEYIHMVREKSMVYASRTLLVQGATRTDLDEIREIYHKLGKVLSSTERMPMMTGPERVADFFKRMKDPTKTKYLPWGIPTADRNVYAELGDMILLGGYASSGKTLLSVLMAQTQAKAGYKVGYYSLETSPQKMTDRQISSLAGVPLWKIKKKEFSDSDWLRFGEAGNFAAAEGDFAIIDASGFTVDDVRTHAICHGFQVIYVDYVQNLLVTGMRSTEEYARVTTISQTLKSFARSTNTAVVALAQLTRPPGADEGNNKNSMPTMHSFKASGQLEQDADVAFLVFPSDRKKNDSDRIFRIAKNKEGRRPDPVYLAFHGDTQTMVELEPGPDRSVAAELAAKGRAVKQANRANGQVEFREIHGADAGNPFA